MDDEDSPSIDRTSTGDTSNATEDGKVSKRHRLKEALNRTKEKIHNVREEHEVKKQHRRQEKDKTNYELDDDVNDFLAAGRTSITSNESPSNDHSRLSQDNAASPRRPSTSDSKLQPSPRRISVPRIDVSSSQRFPNARNVGQAASPGQHEAGNPFQGHSYGNDFLKPVYKNRSQSSSSIARQDRKARVRGLSVGFSNSPPIIIGEGGDEASAPPVEISKAKARARSASPQGRRPLTDENSLVETRGPMAGWGFGNTKADGFQPKPLRRIQTGTLSSPQTSGLDSTTKNFAKSMGFAPHSPVTSSSGGMSATRNFERVMGAATRGPVIEKSLTKEFEMTLGLVQSSTSPQHLEKQGERQIFAPKPQRAPPSYDKIADGSSVTSNASKMSPQSLPMALSDAIMLQTNQAGYQQPQRKPVPSTQTQIQNQNQQYEYPAPALRQRQRGASLLENSDTIDPASKILGPVISTKNGPHHTSPPQNAQSVSTKTTNSFLPTIRRVSPFERPRDP